MVFTAELSLGWAWRVALPYHSPAPLANHTISTADTSRFLLRKGRKPLIWDQGLLTPIYLHLLLFRRGPASPKGTASSSECLLFLCPSTAIILCPSFKWIQAAGNKLITKIKFFLIPRKICKGQSGVRMWVWSFHREDLGLCTKRQAGGCPGWSWRGGGGGGGMATKASCWIAASATGSAAPISGNKLGPAAEAHSGMKEL